MTRFVQLHMLTFYPPANLNRDDTGRPKTAHVGGAERLRISSQSLKRAIRTSDVFRDRLDGHIGTRTLRVGEEVENYLTGKGVEAKRALEIARAIAAGFGDVPTGSGDARTSQLVFVSPEERQQALALADKVEAGEKIEITPKSVFMRADTAADIAMFGRMVAAAPEFNRDAAVQVAHAITTHKVTVEDDFFTAVDDLKVREESMGAGHVGEVGFGSGVFYLYACIDRDLLQANLGGNDELASRAIEALVEAMATTSPSGKQATFASRSRASYILAEKGRQQPRSLASAFVKPVQGSDILITSVEALRKTRDGMDRAYGACADASSEMLVGESGSLAEILPFCGAR